MTTEKHDSAVTASDETETEIVIPAGPPALLKQIFRDQLLSLTLEHAIKNVSAYSILEPQADRITSVNDLSALPLFYKEAMIEDPASFRNPNQDTFLKQHTGGTSGQQLELHRSLEEIQFEGDFLTSIATMDRERPGPGDAATEICVSLHAPVVHGPSTPLPYNGPVLTINPFDPDFSKNAAAIVSAPWTFLNCAPRRAILVGIEVHLRILTSILLESGYDFRQSSITSIIATGDLVTTFRKRWYQEAWRVPIDNRYSMSEIAAGASVCDECHHMHPDTHVIAEAVEPITREPVRSGIGVLVFTTLFPFVQKQPLVRYWTGDVARVYCGICPVDDFGFDFKGRLTHCLLAEDGGRALPLLLGADVQEVLDAIPDVNRSSVHAYVQGIHDATVLGSPKCAVSLEGTAGRYTVKLTVELRYTPIAYPERVHALTEQITSGMLDENADLSAAVKAGDCLWTVELVRPGAIPAFRPGTIDG